MRWLPAVLAILVALTPPGRAEAAAAKPRFERNIPTGETGWFSSPGLVDLDGDRRLEIVAPFYSTFVYDAKGVFSARARRPRGACTPRASSPTSTATGRARSSSVATTAPSRRTHCRAGS